MNVELIGRVMLRTGHIIIDGEVFKLDTLWNVVKAKMQMNDTLKIKSECKDIVMNVLEYKIGKLNEEQ